MLVCISTSVQAEATSSEELFKKVFGSSTSQGKDLKIDATLGEFFIGEISVKITNEKISTISQDDLVRALSEKVRSEKLYQYHLGTGDISPDKLPFKVQYFPAELRLAILIPAEDLKPLDANVYDDLMPYYSRKASEPADFSFGLNYKLEQTLNKNSNQQDSFAAHTDAFINMKKISFENRMNYLSTREGKWARQESRAIFDRPNSMQRIEVGDINYPIIGYQQAYSLGGASFYRDFSLNPYRTVTPTSSLEYLVEGRSLVRTFVNNILLKTEYMNAGRYSISDIPLNNGLNKILIEITDEFGNVRTFNFNESGSLDLLSEGVSRYAVASGYSSYEEEGGKKYERDKGAFVSGFYQHGITKKWTPSLYLQGNKKFSLLGTNQIFSTDYGNWSVDFANSKNDFHQGYVVQGTYQLNLFGAYWYDSHTLTTKVEYRSEYFNEAGENFINRFDTTITASYSVPLLERFNVALGGSYQHPTIAEAPRLAYNGSLTTKIFDASSLTLYAGKSRDEFKNWSNQIYFFFNMSFGESSTFASAFYEKETNTKRLTVIKDNGTKYDDLKIAASVDDNEFNKNGSLDLQYNTVLADIGVREEVSKANSHSESYRTSVRLLSSIAYVNDGSQSAFSIGRPISNSFVIFKPNAEWRGQKFNVQTSSGINDAGTGLFGESLVSGLTPYQYRRLQLDPSRLDPGYTLGQESFVIFPRKNSGHLFVIGKSGLLTLRGKLINQRNEPLPLKVGFWTTAAGKSTAFFTDREGAFFIDGVEAATGTIQIDDDKFMPYSIDLSLNKKGIVDFGTLILPEKDN